MKKVQLKEKILPLATECLNLVKNFNETHKWTIGYKIELQLKRKDFSDNFLNYLEKVHAYLLDPTNEEKKTNMQIVVYGNERTTFVYKDFEGNYVMYMGYNPEAKEHILHKDNKWLRGFHEEERASKYVDEVNEMMGYKAIQYVEEVTCHIR